MNEIEMKARIAELEAQLAAVQQGVQQEKLGETCMDGGTCHHDCKDKCFRRECCEPLSAAIKDGLTMEQWRYSATHPTQQGLEAPTQAARSVIAERARQIATEGYTPEQDDGYNPGVLALHGGLYACHAFDNLTKKRAPEGWQWDEKWWKSKDPRSNLVKAGALILAEIERIDRVCAAQAKQGGV